MTWTIIVLIFAAAATAGFRIQALTRDEPPEPPLAHRWRAMGGNPPPLSPGPRAAEEQPAERGKSHA
jgi:hypothetical protein